MLAAFDLISYIVQMTFNFFFNCYIFEDISLGNVIITCLILSLLFYYLTGFEKKEE